MKTKFINQTMYQLNRLSVLLHILFFCCLFTSVNGQNAIEMTHNANGVAILSIDFNQGNTVIGRSAGSSLPVSSSINANTIIGAEAGVDLISGTSNTLIGERAGNNLVSASGNVFIGKDAGATETGSNRLHISNTFTVNPLIYGEFDTKMVKINNLLKLQPLTSSNAPTCATADLGLIYMDSNTKKLRVCDGTAWQDLH